MLLLFWRLQLQTAVPVSDLDDGSWTNELASTVNLYASIDEAIAVDADYIQSSESPLVPDEVRLTMGPLDDPASSLNHCLRYRYQKDTLVGDTVDLTVRLYAADGVTVIAEQTHTDIEAVTDASLVLSAAEADSIDSADYGAGLVVGFSALKP